MKKTSILTAAGLALLAALAVPQFGNAQSGNKVLRTAKVGGDGGFDYVYADVDGRKLYIPRSGPNPRITVFNLDTLAPLGEIPKSGGHGVAVDPKTHHGFSSSKPVTMFDTNTLQVIKTIDVQGGPDGIKFDPYNERVWVFSHSQPNATVIDAKDGSVVGTVDLGGAPEEAASDGKGHIWVDLESKHAIAAVDAKEMKVTATYDISSKCEGPSGLGYDAKNSLLFATCHGAGAGASGGGGAMVIVSTKDGSIVDSVPIGPGTDGGGFNPKTMEAFSSNGGDGTLTVVKVKGPDSFQAEQIKTMVGAKTMTIDTKTGRVLLIAAEYGPPPEPAPTPAAGARGGRGRRGSPIPGSFSIVVVGK